MALNGLTPAKLIFKPMASLVGIASFASAGGTSESIKAALTTALSSAGEGGVGVPLQAGVFTKNQAAFIEGVLTTAGLNIANGIYLTATGKRLTDGNGNDLYGKVAQNGSDWTLAYFSETAGVETAFAMVAGTTISFDVPYVFTFDHFPGLAGAARSEAHVAPDLATYGWREQVDQLTVPASNTVSTALTKSYDGRKAVLNLFGVSFSDKGANPAFTITGGTTFTWNAANAGVNLDIADNPILTYTY